MTSIAYVGAGGKTTAIFRTARELLISSKGDQAIKSVLVTTSTHLGAWQTQYADHFLTIHSIADIDRLENGLPNGVVLLSGCEKDNLLDGLPSGTLARLHSLAIKYGLPLLIEADGSHNYPLKAPAEFEPAIPDFTQCVAVVVGLMGLGKPLANNWVQRPQKFAKLANLHMGEPVTEEAVVKVLLSVDGGLKNIPSTATRIVLLNQADTPELQSAGRTIGKKLIPDYSRVIISSLTGINHSDAIDEAQNDKKGIGIYAVIEQIGGIIMAAGGSSRFGEPKQLLLWKGAPLIRHAAITALQAGLSPVIVVVGASAEEVTSAIKDLPVRIVNNQEWATGMSTSIKAGVTALPKGIGGVVFMQADQPHIPPALIRSLVETHEATLNPIIAPQIDGQRGNPVLFDVSTFEKLLQLEGDIGGRALFGQYQVRWVPWHDPKILLDIDSPEDYRKFLRAYPEDLE